MQTEIEIKAKEIEAIGIIGTRIRQILAKNQRTEVRFMYKGMCLFFTISSETVMLHIIDDEADDKSDEHVIIFGSTDNNENTSSWLIAEWLDIEPTLARIAYEKTTKETGDLIIRAANANKILQLKPQIV